tara:strand:- start:385 stop:729 length:345 start_codon:yes stop_codon:yes gene_type:complete
MIKNILKQLPSVYFLKDGRHMIEYSVSLPFGYYFTNLKGLWGNALSVEEVNFTSEDKGPTTASWVEYSSERAVKWSQEELDLIFEDLLYVGTGGRLAEVPKHFVVGSYSKKSGE